MDYREKIIDLMNKVHNKELLKQVYKLLKYLYLYKDDENNNTEPKGGESLATEIINDTQDKMNCILAECESLSLDLEKAYFVLKELSEMVGTAPKNRHEALCFANNQHRIYSYTEIAFDYVSRIRSHIDDLIIRIRRAESKKDGEDDKEED